MKIKHFSKFQIKHKNIVAWIMAFAMCLSNVQVASAQEAQAKSFAITQDISVGDVSENNISAGNVPDNDVSSNFVSETIELPSEIHEEEIVRTNAAVAEIFTVMICYVNEETGEQLGEQSVLITERGILNNEGEPVNLVRFFTGFMPVSAELTNDPSYALDLITYIKKTNEDRHSKDYLDKLYLKCDDFPETFYDMVSTMVVSYIPAKTGEHYYILDGAIQEQPAFYTYTTLYASIDLVPQEYYDPNTNKVYRQIGVYNDQFKLQVMLPEHCNYYDLKMGDEPLNCNHYSNWKWYHVMSSNPGDPSTTHYRFRIYDIFKNPDGSIRERILRTDEYLLKHFQYAAWALLDPEYYDYYTYEADEIYYQGTSVEDFTIEFVYRERDDFGSLLTVKHLDVETGEEIAPQSLITTVESGTYDIPLAQVKNLLFIPEKTTYKKTKSGLTTVKIAEDGAHVTCATARPGITEGTITCYYQYYSEIALTVTHQDVSGNIIQETKPVLLTQDSRNAMIPVVTDGYRLLTTKTDTNCNGLIFETKLEEDEPVVIANWANFKRGQYKANLVLIYEEYTPETTLQVTWRDTKGNTLKDAENYVFTPDNLAVDIPVIMNGYKLQTSDLPSMAEGLQYVWHNKDGQTWIRVTCPESFLGEKTDPLHIKYQPLDSISFYQLVDGRMSNKKLLLDMTCNEVTGEYHFADFVTPENFDGYVFKGYVYGTEEEIKQNKKDGTLSFAGSVVFTDADTGEHADVYLIYEQEAFNQAATDGLWIEPISAQKYMGKAIKPQIKVYDGGTLLKEKTDYVVSYKNNTNVSSSAKKATITVTGKGNYSGKETVTFEIEPVSLADEAIQYTSVCTTYNKKVQKPTPVITYNGKKLKKNKDFTIQYSSKNNFSCKEPGEYVIRVTGQGNYTGTIDIPFVIVEKSKNLISKTKVGEISAQEYTGSPIRPAVSLTVKKQVLTAGKDYAVSYRNNTAVGTGYIDITGKGDYTGKITVPFRITGSSLENAQISKIEPCMYNGDAHTPDFTVTYKGKTLVPDKDYIFWYKNNIRAGLASVVVKGVGVYEGEIEQVFQIKGITIQKEWFGDGEDIVVPYEKGGATPGVSGTFDKEDLIEGKDYVLSYRDNQKPAKSSNLFAPTITVTGIGDYQGTVDIKFTIVAKDLKNTTSPVAIKVSNVAYSNKAGQWESKPVLIDSNGQRLLAGVDYDKDLRYTTRTGKVLTKDDTPAAGEVIRVTATGKGNYTGTITGTYTVTAASISKAKGKIENQEYTGSAVTLSGDDFSLKNGKADLIYGKDFEIVEGSYKSNIKKGTASVTIRGLGNYGGEKTLKFKIIGKRFVWFWNLF